MKHLRYLILAAVALLALAGCDPPQPTLPDTPSKPKPASLDKNVFVPSGRGN
jgi:uncharacterized lipoprotein YajG